MLKNKTKKTPANLQCSQLAERDSRHTAAYANTKENCHVPAVSAPLDCLVPDPSPAPGAGKEENLGLRVPTSERKVAGQSEPVLRMPFERFFQGWGWGSRLPAHAQKELDADPPDCPWPHVTQGMRAPLSRVQASHVGQLTAYATPVLPGPLRAAQKLNPQPGSFLHLWSGTWSSQNGEILRQERGTDAQLPAGCLWGETSGANALPWK